MNDTLRQASPERAKKQQEDADRAMRELLEEEDKAAGAPVAASQKKKQGKSAKEHSRLVAEGQGLSKRDSLLLLRSRKIRRGQRRRLSLRRRRLRMLQRYR